MTRADRGRAFRSHWSRLAYLGDCDGLDGAQFRRAWRAYNLAGFPHPLTWLVAWLAADEATRPATTEQHKGA